MTTSPPSPPPPTIRYRRKPNVLVRELDGEAVLLDLDSGRYFGLNATGMRIWALLAEVEAFALTEIRERLAAEYAATPEAIAADLLELCSVLEAEGLIDRVG